MARVEVSSSRSVPLSRSIARRSETESASSSPLRRAVANLMLALRQKAFGGVDEATAHQIADILDEAARKIERMGTPQ